MSEKKVRKVTPIGEAKWAHLQKPKQPFKDESGRVMGTPKYQIDVVFSADDPAWKAWATSVADQIRAMPETVDKHTGEKMKKQNPIKRELDENDQPTGKFYVTFKTAEKFKPPVYDRAGNLIDKQIGNGSKVRVSYIEYIYTAFGGGLSFYLNAVQVMELTEFQSQSPAAFGFDVVQQEVADNLPF